jgi:serine/threonine protein kinase
MGIDEQARSRVGLVYNQKYTLGRLIGSGGMAAVYEATHRNGHRVAIKILHRHISAEEELRARFLREGYVANKVGHPGAVRVIDDDIAEDGSVFLVMDLLEGETLDARAKRLGGRLPTREACSLAVQALDVLVAAHEKGVIHRDVKPENLFLTVDGSLKVLDFGIARVLLETTEKMTATRAGVMIGTPAFMAPEQALGQTARIDGQTDLWAVAATTFTMISGQFVHEAETMEEMLIRAGSMQARSVLAVVPDLPPSIANVIDRALSFAKTERWLDARDMRAALEDACRLSYGATSTEEGEPSRGSSTSAVSSSVAFAPTIATGTLAEHLPFPLMPSSQRASTGNGIAQEEIRLPVRVQWAPLLLGLGVLAGVVAGAVAVERQVGPIASSASPAPPPPSAAPSILVTPSIEAPPASAAASASAPASPIAAPSRSAPPAPSAAPSEKAHPSPDPVPMAKPTSGPPEFVPPMPWCSPNFIIDSEGHKIFKPECFPRAPPL